MFRIFRDECWFYFDFTIWNLHNFDLIWHCEKRLQVKENSIFDLSIYYSQCIMCYTSLLIEDFILWCISEPAITQYRHIRVKPGLRRPPRRCSHAWSQPPKVLGFEFQWTFARFPPWSPGTLFSDALPMTSSCKMKRLLLFATVGKHVPSSRF